MQVFKFGGASVNSTGQDPDKLPTFSPEHRGQPLVVVVSAMGKTTNELEKVAEAFLQGATGRKRWSSSGTSS